MRRNYTADLIKFIAAVLIMTAHFPTTYTFIVPNMAVVPILFFVISGVLMAASLEKYQGENIGKETVKFIRGKLRGFWAYYVVAFVIAFVLYQIGSRSGIKDAAFSFTQGIWELLLVQYAGFNKSIYFIGGTWYLSTMIIAFAILVPLALRFKDTYRAVIAPLVCIFIYGYLFNEYQSLVKVNWYAGERIYNSLLLAVSGITLGNCVYSLSKGLMAFNFKKSARIFLHIVEFSLLGLFLPMPPFSPVPSPTAEITFTFLPVPWVLSSPSGLTATACWKISLSPFWVSCHCPCILPTTLPAPCF